MYKLYIELCIVLIISWLFDSPFPTCDQWSMIQPGQLGTPGRRSNTCIFQWTVVCHGFQVGSSWLKSWGFEANKKKHTDQRGPRAKGQGPFFLFEALFVGCGTDWARFKLWAFFEYHPWGHPCARTIPVCVREDWPPRARRWKRRGAIETTVAQKTHRFSWQMMMK